MSSRHITTVTLNPAIDLTLHVPGLQLGAVNRVSATRTNAGGKGINVASLLADAGFAVTATGWLGSANAAIFAQLFARKQIRDQLVRLSGETRTSVKLVDPQGAQTTDLNGVGPAASDGDLAALVERVDNLAGQSDWVVLAGSLPPGTSPAIYADLVELCVRRGARVALDTSGEPLARGLAARPTLVKPNLAELGELRGAVTDVRAAARELLASGIAEVVISLGAEGALFATPGEAIFARPPRVEVASTVGAGDAMVAGLVAGHCWGLDLAGRARLATAFAAHAVSVVGNDLASTAELAALQEEVRLETVTPQRKEIAR